MTVNAFTSTPSGTGTFNSGGTATLNIGATLAVGANQTAGSYTGTFSVTVDYN
jgi:spore coat protein U-like protein